MIRSEIIKTLRIEYTIDSSILGDELMNRFIDRGIKKISQYNPYKEVTSTVTQKNVTRYTVYHEKLIKVTHVYYMQGYSTQQLFGDPAIPLMLPYARGTFIPSREFTRIMEDEMFRKYNPCDGVLVDNDKFDLIPTPVLDGLPVFYDYDRFCDIEEIPDIFEEDLIDLFFYYKTDAKAKDTINDSKTMKYAFDRKGNTLADKYLDMGDDFRKRRESILAGIVKSIQSKVMSI